MVRIICCVVPTVIGRYYPENIAFVVPPSSITPELNTPITQEQNIPENNITSEFRSMMSLPRSANDHQVPPIQASLSTDGVRMPQIAGECISLTKKDDE